MTCSEKTVHLLRKFEIELWVSAHGVALELQFALLCLWQMRPVSEL